MPLDDNTLSIPGFDFEPPPADEPEPMAAPGEDDAHTPEPPRPINWNLLTAEEAQVEWLELNAWINWLRHTYGLSVGRTQRRRHPAAVAPASRTHLGAVGVAPTLAKRIRAEAARFGSDRLAPRLR